MKAVLLVSGGLDSTTCLAIAREQDFDLYALTINYGQRHDHELNSAKMVVDFYSIQDHSIIDIDLRQFGGSALTDQIDVPKNRDPSEMVDIPATYVPARNTVFLSLALAWAETLGSSDIFIGVNALDYSGYPDCRPEYYEKMRESLCYGSKLWAQYKVPMHIETPIIHLSKAQIVEMAMELKVPLQHTWSCYQGNEHPCRVCDSCVLRAKGFSEAGFQDPLSICQDVG